MIETLGLWAMAIGNGGGLSYLSAGSFEVHDLRDTHFGAEGPDMRAISMTDKYSSLQVAKLAIMSLLHPSVPGLGRNGCLCS